MMLAPASWARSRTSARSARQRKLGSSWNPISIRSAPEAVAGIPRRTTTAASRMRVPDTGSRVPAPLSARPPDRPGSGRRLPPPLRLAPPALLVEAALAGGESRRRRPPWAQDPQRITERLGQALQRELAVSPLAALVLRDRADDGAGAGEHTALLRRAQRSGGLDVEHRLDSGLRLLGVLAPGPARA